MLSSYVVFACFCNSHSSHRNMGQTAGCSIANSPGALGNHGSPEKVVFGGGFFPFYTEILKQEPCGIFGPAGNLRWKITRCGSLWMSTFLWAILSMSNAKGWAGDPNFSRLVLPWFNGFYHIYKCLTVLTAIFFIFGEVVEKCWEWRNQTHLLEHLPPSRQLRVALRRCQHVPQIQVGDWYWALNRSGMLLALTWLVNVGHHGDKNMIKQHKTKHSLPQITWIFHTSIAGTFWWNSPPRSKKYRRWPKYVSTRVAWPKMRMELQWTQQPIASIFDYPIDFTMDSSPFKSPIRTGNTRDWKIKSPLFIGQI